MANEAGGERSVNLRCGQCREEQLIQMGPGLDSKAECEVFLCLMTGGHYGSTPFPFIKTREGDGSIIGRSKCCNAQLEGEVIEHGPKA